LQLRQWQLHQAYDQSPLVATAPKIGVDIPEIINGMASAKYSRCLTDVFCSKPQVSYFGLHLFPISVIYPCFGVSMTFLIA
jgi:hypothetical protein